MAEFIVTTRDDQNDGGDGGAELSLREAIRLANNSPGPDIITFAAGAGEAFEGGGTIALGGTELSVTDELSIDGDVNGDGRPDVTVDADGQSRVFNIRSAANAVELSGLTVTGGYAERSGGGGIYTAADLTLRDSVVIGNATDGTRVPGGGIFAVRDLTLSGSTVSGNSTDGTQSSGGGIYAGGALTLDASTVHGNTAHGTASAGGGIYGGDSVTLIDSTVSGNATFEASSRGGGIFGTALVTLVNATISGNSAAGSGSNGGGLFAETASLTNSTVSGNYSSADGGGIFFGGTLTLTDSIVLGNSAEDDDDEISGSSRSFTGQNIVGATMQAFDATNLPNVSNADPASVFAATGDEFAAGALADNGGPVATVALRNDAANPALDVSAGADIPQTDARGGGAFDQPGVGTDGGPGIRDLGAFELDAVGEAPSLVVTTASDVVDAFDGVTSLREAVAFANAEAGADTVTFDAGVFSGGAASLIRLTQGQIEMTGETTIDGATGTEIVITGDANGDDMLVAGTNLTDVAASGAASLDDNTRLFLLTGSAADTRFDSLTLTGGRTTADSEPGGAIRADLAEVTLTNSTVSGNSTAGFRAEGGGIRADTATLMNSTVSGNRTGDTQADGGGIRADIATLTNSTVSGNSTAGDVADGGGIRADTATLTNSTISGNSTEGTSANGGGIRADTATLTNSKISGNSTEGLSADGGGLFALDAATLTNSTISGNSTEGNNAYGGGLYAYTAATLTNSTISGNRTDGANAEGGGLFAYTAATLTNSLVLGNDSAQTGADETGGAAPSLTNSIIAGDAAAIFAQTQANGAATAGVLADNGGPVQTIALKADLSNPALDIGTSALATDATGQARDVDLAGADNGGTVDAGAFEVQPSSDPVVGAALVEITPDGALGASTFANGSFQITNQGPAEILSISIDLSTGILPDMVFDPVGAGGDATSQCLTPDSGAAATGFIAPTDPCVDPFSEPRNGGFDVITVEFDDFQQDESFTFSVDVDPNSIQGVPGAGAPGSVSGYELIGATVSVTYADGVSVETVTSSLYDQGTLGGGQAVVDTETMLPAPSIALAGPGVDQAPLPGDQISVLEGQTAQTVTVTGTPGAIVSLLQMDARFFIASGELPSTSIRPRSPSTQTRRRRAKCSTAPRSTPTAPPTFP